VKVVAPRHGDVDARKGSPFDVGCLNWILLRYSSECIYAGGQKKNVASELT
jgi:hypothetical protein